MTSLFDIPNIRPGGDLVLIAGPCVIEDDRSPIAIAEALCNVCDALNVSLIFKASFRKDNRTRFDSFTGIGDRKALAVLRHIGQTFGVPTITDIHKPEDAALAAEHVDVLQIPAFLCRQTSLLKAAADTGSWINVKKGQYLSADAMQHVVEKLHHFGADKVMLTERGTFFGYQDLVVDFRGIPIMRQFAPVIFDCTHSNQQPNQAVGVSGGNPEMIQPLARAAVAIGVDGLFVEVHPDPPMALSDGANMLSLDLLETFLQSMIDIKKSASP